MSSASTSPTTSTSTLASATEIIYNTLQDHDESVALDLMKHWLESSSEVNLSSEPVTAKEAITEVATITEDSNGQDVVTGIKPDYRDHVDDDDDDGSADSDTSKNTNLEALDGIGPGKAASLRSAGIETIEDVLTSQPETLKAIDSINEATVKKAQKDATRFLDSKAVVGADAIKQGREAEVGTEAPAHQIRTIAGEPTGELYEDILPVLEPPCDDPSDHPLFPDIDEDAYIPREVRGLSLMGQGGTVEPFDTDKTDLEVATMALAKNNHPLLLRGKNGTGKNFLIDTIAANTNRPVVRVPFGDGMTYDELVGQVDIETDEDGNQDTVFKPGLLTLAVKYGWIFIADEINAAPAECTMPLHGVTEEDPQLTIRETNEILTPHEEFRFVATMNPPEPGKFNGTNEMNVAFKDRFLVMDMDYLDIQNETNLVDSKVNDERQIVKKDQIRNMAKVASRIRSREQDGDAVPIVSTRALVKAADMCDLMEPQTALKMVLNGLINPNKHNPSAVKEAMDAIF